MLNDLFSASTAIFLDIGFPGPGEFKDVQAYTDEIFSYAWDSGIAPFASAAIGFKVLMWFINAVKGE